MAKRRSNKHLPKSPIVMKTGLNTVIGNCKDCNAQWSGKATSIDAIQHFKDTGHHIRVEQHTWWEPLFKP